MPTIFRPKNRVVNAVPASATQSRQWTGQVRVGSAFALEQSMLTILLVVLVLMALGAIPAWPHSRSWGYAPSGLLTILVVVLLVLVLTGRV